MRGVSYNQKQTVATEMLGEMMMIYENMKGRVGKFWKIVRTMITAANNRCFYSRILLITCFKLMMRGKEDVVEPRICFPAG